MRKVFVPVEAVFLPVYDELLLPKVELLTTGAVAPNIIISLSELHRLKQPSPICVTPAGIVMLLNDLHSEKRLSGNAVTPDGIFTDVKLGLNANDVMPIVVTVSGNTIVLIVVPRNAVKATAVTL